MSEKIFSIAKISPGTRIRMRAVLNLLKKIEKKDFILECGCGVGVYTEKLQAIPKNLFCFDINPSLVSIASSVKNNSLLFVGDINNMPLSDSSVSVAIAADIIEHMKKPIKSLKEIRRVLKPEGHLIITTPSSLWDPIYCMFGMRKEDVGHYNIYNKKKIKYLLDNSGFRLDSFKLIQSIPTAFMDIFFSWIAMLKFGKRKVIDSEMTIEAGKNSILSFLYQLICFTTYPFLFLLEFITPNFCMTECLIKAKKK